MSCAGKEGGGVWMFLCAVENRLKRFVEAVADTNLCPEAVRNA